MFSMFLFNSAKHGSGWLRMFCLFVIEFRVVFITRSTCAISRLLEYGLDSACMLQVWTHLQKVCQKLRMVSRQRSLRANVCYALWQYMWDFYLMALRKVISSPIVRELKPMVAQVGEMALLLDLPEFMLPEARRLVHFLLDVCGTKWIVRPIWKVIEEGFWRAMFLKRFWSWSWSMGGILPIELVSTSLVGLVSKPTCAFASPCVSPCLPTIST
jgi:hypothetical protein